MPTNFEDTKVAAEGGDWYVAERNVYEKKERFTSDKPAKYYVEKKGDSYSELVVPDDELEEKEEVIEFAKEALAAGVSYCKDCGESVPVGSLECPTGSYVANTCSDCKNACSGCGAKSWTVKKSSGTSTTKPTVYACTECGNTKKGITTG